MIIHVIDKQFMSKQVMLRCMPYNKSHTGSEATIKCCKISQKVRYRTFLKPLNCLMYGKCAANLVNSAANICEMCGKSAANFYGNKLTSL